MISLLAEPKPVRENELGGENVEFASRGALAWREIKNNDEVIVVLGDVSMLTVIFAFTLVVSIASASILLQSDVHRGILFGSVIVGAFVFAGYLSWMKSRPCTRLHLRRGACSIDFGGCIVHNISVSSVVVISSQFYRDGGESLDGVSELFLKYFEEGSICYFPIASTSGKGGTMHLGKRMAGFLEVPVVTQTR
jgi:uncharacterized membrane protein (DUF485 family)